MDTLLLAIFPLAALAAIAAITYALAMLRQAKSDQILECDTTHVKRFSQGGWNK